ncbi:MAG: hypothetical protein ACPG4T_07075, partial [Nannocystaceae bacterium]
RATKIVTLCVTLAWMCPAPARAVAPDVDEATKHYKAGLKRMRADDFVGAAEEFSIAFDLVPTAQRETRAGVLFDLVGAERRAAKGQGQDSESDAVSSSRHLCRARSKLTTYLSDITQQYGEKSDKFRDTRKAKKVLKAVEQEIVDVGEIIPEACASLDEDQEASTDAGSGEVDEQGNATPGRAGDSSKPGKKPGQGLVIAGAATLGTSGVFWGLMFAGMTIGNRADADGDVIVDASIAAGNPISASDPTLLVIERRGKRGNNLAIAGGVVATALAATGIALLVVGLGRRGKRKQVAIHPSFGRTQVGVGLAGRF